MSDEIKWVKDAPPNVQPVVQVVQVLLDAIETERAKILAQVEQLKKLVGKK